MNDPLRRFRVAVTAGAYFTRANRMPFAGALE